jgi:hypothetical protein
VASEFLPATTTEITMKRTRRHDDVSGLPEPIVLTPDQLKEIAMETAGGCGCGCPPPPVYKPPTIHGGNPVMAE